MRPLSSSEPFRSILVCRVTQRILHAIQQADPFYDHVKWAAEAQQNEVYMRNICQMPRALHPSRDEATGEEDVYNNDII